MLESLLISSFRSIMNLFIRELERKWANEKLTDSTFAESEKSAKEILLKTFADVTLLAATALDGDNLWTEYDISIKEYFLDKKQAVV